MFLGHYAVALGAKRAAPRASLGTLIAAAAFLDLVWPVLVLLGLERVAVEPGATAFTPLDFEYYPISHSVDRRAPLSACSSLVASAAAHRRGRARCRSRA